MKKLIPFIVFLLPVFCKASPLVTESPIISLGTASTVSISTSTWTKVPATSTLGARTGIKVNNPSTNNASVVCTLDTTAPTIATTIRPIEIQKGENPFIPVRVDVLLYCLSLHTSAENIHAQEVGQ